MKRLSVAAAVLSTAAVADISPFWESVYGEETPSEKVFGAGAVASRPKIVKKRSSGAWHPSLDAIEYHSVARLASKGEGAEVAADTAAAAGPEWRKMEKLTDSMWLDAHQAQEESPKPAAQQTAFLRPAHVEAAVQASSEVHKGEVKAVGSVASWRDFAAATEPFQDEGVKDALLREHMGETVAEMKSEAVVDTAQAARESAALEHREAVLELGKLRQAMQKVKPSLLQIPFADKSGAAAQAAKPVPAKEETIEMKREDDVAARVAKEESDLHRFSYKDAEIGTREVPVHAHVQKDEKVHVHAHMQRSAATHNEAKYPMDPSPALPHAEAHASAQEAAHAHAHAGAGAESLEAVEEEEAAADEADHTEVHFKSASERAGHNTMSRHARAAPKEPIDLIHDHDSGSRGATTWAACAIAAVSVVLSAAA